MWLNYPAILLLANHVFPTSTSPTPYFARDVSTSSNALNQFALQKVLQDASPIFGPYTKTTSKTATWMKAYPDSTKLVHMNLPGTHDTQTWNYSLETQKALSGITELGGRPVLPPSVFRCQQEPIIAMLDAGIRVFDLRFAFDVLNSSLVFWHGQALQSETATVEDVLFGFYRWLDEHPSEAVLMSLNYEGSTTRYARNDAAVQMAIFDVLTTKAAKKYFVQKKNEFATLGEARGKITLLRRFGLDALPASYSEAIQGVPFPASQWQDNSPDLALVYNTSKNLTAYIEDFYEPATPPGSGAALSIEMKYNATIAHLSKAATSEQDSLFWTFASAEFNAGVPTVSPRIMATGNGTESTPLGGVNQRLVPFLRGMKGKRVGIVMFDFFGTPGGLVETLLSL
ncbi:PLC-like phosphodiesterase [Rhexocercosporidium sp. MPI-PUGE-AT-0058]|nr:PLC-like phosphodiesterase [Rhexocercosporidium sp. MPI-PUGE-AT-0058]